MLTVIRNSVIWPIVFKRSRFLMNITTERDDVGCNQVESSGILLDLESYDRFIENTRCQTDISHNYRIITNITGTMKPMVADRESELHIRNVTWWKSKI